MNNLFVLLKKEMLGLRQFNYISLLAVFIIFAIGTPIILYLLPNIVASEQPELAELMPHLLDLPGIMDSFMGGISQLGLLAVALTFATISEERSKGITSLILVKSVSRTIYLLSKIIAAAIAMTLISLISFCLLGYTTWVFIPDFSVRDMLYSLLLIWIYLIMASILAVEISALFKKTWAGSLTLLGTLIALSVIPAIVPDNVDVYFPGRLLGLAISAAQGAFSWEYAWTSIVGALLIVTSGFVLSQQIFSRAEL